MTGDSAIARRGFLGLLGAWAGSWVAGGAAASGPRDRSAARAALPARLARLAGPRESARVVGRAYLAQVPEERDPERLTRLVLADAAGARGDLRAWLRGRVRRDFAEERVVALRGWVLSRTEARLCGLAALTER